MICMVFTGLALVAGMHSAGADGFERASAIEDLLPYPDTGAGADSALTPLPAVPGEIPGCVDGWPVFLNPPSSGFPYTVTLFDADGDGADELFCTGGETFGIEGDGSFMPGWPTTEMLYMGYGTNDQKPGPSCADLEGDGLCEILWSERDWYAGSSHMWCFNGRHSSGSSMEGFPRTAPDEPSNALDSPFVLGDADGDGDLEAWSAHTLGNTGDYYRISGLDHLGNMLFTTDLDPGENILDIYFGDADGSGQEEFFAVTMLSGAFRLHLFTPSGGEQSGYPVELFEPSGGYLTFGRPIPVDLDEDGDLEIILGYWSSSAVAQARHHDGTAVAGFPVTIASGVQLFYLGLGDVNEDGFPELLATGKILAAGTYGLWAVDLAGGLVPGWPVTSPGWPEGYPTVVDVDGDGIQEVCFVTDGAQLFAIAGSGAVVPGFPKTLNGASYSGVAAGDIDGDGYYELAAVSTNGWAHAWDTEGVVAPGSAEWPMRGVDARNTGVFHVTGSTGIGGEGSGADPGTVTLEVLGNPALGSAVFLLSDPSCAEVGIFDLSGRMIARTAVEADGRAVWTPGSGSYPGLYFAAPLTDSDSGAPAAFVLLR